jgi:hypothetical protein
MKTRKLSNLMLLSFCLVTITLTGCYTQLAFVPESVSTYTPSYSYESTPPQPTIIVIGSPSSEYEPNYQHHTIAPTITTTSSPAPVETQESIRRSGYERGSYSDSNASQTPSSSERTQPSGAQRQGRR